jgi:hypothetical protein
MLANYGESFASAEGLEDALDSTPAMLYQTDEIDSFIRAMKDQKESRYEKLLETLKKIATSAGGIYPKRRKAGQSGGHIRNPHLVIMGTAVPQHFYAALNERFLSDGFFGRMLVLEAGRRGHGQTAKGIDPPARIVSQCEWWRDYAPGGGMFGAMNPTPAVVPYSPDAELLLDQTRRETEREYSKAETAGDNGSCAVWARVCERARQLALIYAISANCLNPVIDLLAAEWAISFAMRLARFTLQRVAGSVAENPHDEMCMRLLEKLKSEQAKELHWHVALRRMKTSVKELEQVVHTLVERHQVSYVLPEGDIKKGIRGKLVLLKDGL